MNKSKLLFVSLMLAFGASMAHGSAAARTAKEITASAYTSQMTTMTQAVTFGQTAPAVVYQVYLATNSAPGVDWLILYDTNACQAIPAGGSNTSVKYRLSPSTTATSIVFDPPVQFNNGLCMQPSGTTVFGTVTWEPGRNVGAN